MNDSVRQTASQRVADLLRPKLLAKDALAGSRVPTIRQVAQDYQVSVNTAMYALRQLEDEGLIRRSPNAPGFIAGQTDDEGALEKQKDITEAADVSAKQVAVVGPIGPRQDYAWADEWGVRIIMGAEQALLASGKYMPVRVGSIAPEEGVAIDQIIDQVKSMREVLAGVLVPSANTLDHERLFGACDDLGLPWVAVNRPVHHRLNNFVSLDNLGAGKLVGRCLLGLGVRRIFVIARDFSFPSDANKVLGLMHAYMLVGAPTDGVHCVACGGHGEIDGYEAMNAYLQKHGPPEAIFGVGDMLGAGAMRACLSQGLTVPHDVRVLGGTGLDLAEYTSPAMAVLAQPMKVMGERAVTMLLRLIDSGQQQIAGELIMPRLIPRESLGAKKEVDCVLRDLAKADQIMDRKIGVCDMAT